jgi:hypothetical protein
MDENRPDTEMLSYEFINTSDAVGNNSVETSMLSYRGRGGSLRGLGIDYPLSRAGVATVVRHIGLYILFIFGTYWAVESRVYGRIMLF